MGPIQFFQTSTGRTRI
jgi:CubicO group peptidase (beta-lactamase class C family)